MINNFIVADIFAGKLSSDFAGSLDASLGVVRHRPTIYACAFPKLGCGLGCQQASLMVGVYRCLVAGLLPLMLENCLLAATGQIEGDVFNVLGHVREIRLFRT